MILIRSSVTDPAFNLAAEEYHLSRAPEDGEVCMLWRNAPAVILGHGQNAYTELDIPYVEAHDIAVIRRLTGGGAVFHDLGNINYTFISRGEALDFARFTRPVLDALAALGIEASLSGRNDLTVGGRKISGSAQCVKNGFVLHHGTLLFDADLSVLAAALRPDPEKLAAKGVASVRSRVCNLRPLLPEDRDMDAPAFLAYLEDELAALTGGVIRERTAEETAAVAALREEKYARWEWNYGRSPKCAFLRKKRFPFGTVEVGYDLVSGRLSGVTVHGDFFGTADVAAAENALCGCRFDRGEIAAALTRADVASCIAGSTAEEIAALICGEDAGR